MDTYDIEFLGRSGDAKDSIEGIYNDQLQDIISDRTGLALSL